MLVVLEHYSIKALTVSFHLLLFAKALLTWPLQGYKDAKQPRFIVQNRIFMAGVIILVAGSSAYRAHSDTAESILAPPTAPAILVLGDSISAAYGIKREQGWVNLLQQYLLQHRNEVKIAQTMPAYKIINASISGETTGGARARLPKLLLKHQPSIVIIELGGNDALRGYPIQTLRDNLNNMTQLSQQAKAQVLIVGMRIPPNYGKHYTEMFYNSFKETASNHGAALVPFLLDEIAIYPKLMQRDGIHPTAQAQAQLLENILPHLQPLLSK